MKDDFASRPEGLSIAQLCALYHNDDEHAACVARLAVEIFEKTRAVHALDDAAIPLLKAGAMLHNVGLFFGVSGHHVRSKEIILEHGLADFSERETVVVALMALFHRKRVRPQKEPLFVALSPEDQILTLKLSAILRVADGLDYFQDQSTRLTYYDDTRRTLRFYLSNKSPSAWANAQRAVRKADLWAEVLPRQVRFVVEGGQRYYLRRGDTMQAAAYKVFSQFFHALLVHEKGARLREDPEDLHQLRVATRRLRSSLRPFRKVFGRETLAPFAEDLRRIISATGEVRDLDVFMEALDTLPSAHGAPSFLAHLEERHHVAVAQMLATLDDPSYAHFKERFWVFLTNIHPWNRPIERKAAQKRVCVEAPAILSARLKEVLAFRDNLKTDDDNSLHRLRIACKRFRYVADFLSEAIDVKRNVLLRPFREMQDTLGEIHDASVRAVYIRRYIEEKGETLHPDEKRALEALLVENQGRKDQFLEQFLRQWSEFLAEPFQSRLRLLVDPKGCFLC